MFVVAPLLMESSWYVVVMTMTVIVIVIMILTIIIIIIIMNKGPAIKICHRLYVCSCTTAYGV